MSHSLGYNEPWLETVFNMKTVPIEEGEPVVWSIITPTQTLAPGVTVATANSAVCAGVALYKIPVGGYGPIAIRGRVKARCGGSVASNDPLATAVSGGIGHFVAATAGQNEFGYALQDDAPDVTGGVAYALIMLDTIRGPGVVYGHSI